MTVQSLVTFARPQRPMPCRSLSFCKYPQRIISISQRRRTERSFKQGQLCVTDSARNSLRSGASLSHGTMPLRNCQAAGAELNCCSGGADARNVCTCVLLSLLSRGVLSWSGDPGAVPAPLPGFSAMLATKCDGVLSRAEAKAKTSHSCCGQGDIRLLASPGFDGNNILQLHRR
ncbi:hypothetical protein BC827DRAFT_136600 [Russula dissimulans]|nr:hypothetical protein BC827DRAFT_136600 [Russula dissimulans]